MKEHGVQIYPGGGKNPWVKSFCFMIFDFMNCEENGYAPRSHGCMPTETEFAGGFDPAQ